MPNVCTAELPQFYSDDTLAGEYKAISAVVMYACGGFAAVQRRGGFIAFVENIVQTLRRALLFSAASLWREYCSIYGAWVSFRYNQCVGLSFGRALPFHSYVYRVRLSDGTPLTANPDRALCLDIVELSATQCGRPSPSSLSPK